MNLYTVACPKCHMVIKYYMKDTEIIETEAGLTFVYNDQAMVHLCKKNTR